MPHGRGHGHHGARYASGQQTQDTGQGVRKAYVEFNNVEITQLENLLAFVCLLARSESIHHLLSLAPFGRLGLGFG